MARLKLAGFLIAGLASVFVFIVPVSVTAALANVSHAYSAEGPISNGSLVSLAQGKIGYVTAANVNNGKRLTGVSVEASDSLLAVNPSSNTAQVAITGSANALVSTVNGDINVGDQISVSPFSGIGMKAEPGLNVIGLAQTALNGHTVGVTREEVTNKQGVKQSVLVGYVNITINITTDNATGNSNLNGLQKIVQDLTGHVASTVRIIISLIVSTITLLALVTVVYSAIYGSIVSIGRNPLAKHAIFGTLRSVMFMASLVALVACLIVYLLLR